MREFIEIVNEALSDPLPYKWVTKSQTYWRAIFEVEGVEYNVTASLMDDFPHPDDDTVDGDWYDLSFGLTSDYFAGSKVVGTNGMAFKIFSTAVSAFGDFLREAKPELISMSASKENPNRYRVYQRMAKAFSEDLSALGYVRIEPTENRHVQTSKYFDTMAWRKDA